jgi:hypothetical protein
MRSSTRPIALNYALPPPARSWAQVRRNAAMDRVDLWCGVRGMILVGVGLLFFIGPRGHSFGLAIGAMLVGVVGETVVALAWRQRRRW